MGSTKDFKPSYVTNLMTSEERVAENLRVWELRENALVGRTITGSLVVTFRKNGKKAFWIKWNKSKCDKVLINAHIVESAGNPIEGDQLKCTITGIGPDLKFLRSAWCAHPVASKVEVVERKARFSPVLNKIRNAIRKTSPLNRSRFFNCQADSFNWRRA